MGNVPEGGLSIDIGAPSTVGKGERVPTNVDCATPAAINREIPLPIPHLLTSSSRRKTSKEPKNNFYYRFIDYVLNERHPRNDSIIVQDKYGYKHLLDKRYDPRVINPLFIFDQHIWNNPNNFKIIPF